MPDKTIELEQELSESAKRIHYLDREAVKTVLELKQDEKNLDKLFDILGEHTKLKKKLKEQLLDVSSAKITDKEALQVLRKIDKNEHFQCDKILQKMANIDGGTLRKEIFDDEELDDLSFGLFYQEFHPHLYLEGLFEVNCLLVNVNIPEILNSYLDETRKCYSLSQYKAVYSLCRTILEISVRDIGHKTRKLARDTHNYKNWETRNWAYMRDKVIPLSLMKEVKAIYNKTSGLVHGNIEVGKKQSIDMMKRTLYIIQKLYDYYFKEYEPVFRKDREPKVQ